MLFAGITLNIFASIIALLICGLCVYAIRILLGLKNRLNTSIVLIPLYKNKLFAILSCLFIFAMMIWCFIGFFSYTDSLIYLINLFVALIAIFILLIYVTIQRFAVTDSGIIVPCRFIDWLEFCDFEIDGSSVYFTGDKNGFYSLTSTTIKMSFNPSDLNKLEIILTKNRKKIT